MIDLVYLQIHGSQQQLLFLPEAKRDAASHALADVDFEQKEREQQHRSSGYSLDSENALFEEKLQILSTVLSPAELDEFRLRHSPTAQKLRMEVQYFNATPEEFKQLLDACENDGARILEAEAWAARSWDYNRDRNPHPFAAHYSSPGADQEPGVQDYQSRKAAFDEQLKEALGEQRIAEQTAAEQARIEAERLRQEAANQQQALAELTTLAQSVGLGADDAQRFFDRLLELQPELEK